MHLPDLALCDFFLLPKLKMSLNGLILNHLKAGQYDDSRVLNFFLGKIISSLFSGMAHTLQCV
jgi:hypothetical protein